MSERAPIHLIGGSGSSGTTLLAHLLDGLGAVRSGPELAAFHHRGLYRAENFRRTLFNLFCREHRGRTITIDQEPLKLVPNLFLSHRDFYGIVPPAGAHDLFAASTDVAAFIHALRRSLVKKHGFPDDFVWIDQTPKNAIAAREFLETFPQATFIHLIRDGRDTMLSLAKRLAIESPGLQKNTYLSMGLVRWTYDNAQALRASELPGYLPLRYEDLVNAPLDVINTILQRVGQPAVSQEELDTPHSYAARVVPQKFLGGPKQSWNNQPGDGVKTSSVGRWREAFTPELVERAMGFEFTVPDEKQSYRFGDIMQRLGYV